MASYKISIDIGLTRFYANITATNNEDAFKSAKNHLETMWINDKGIREIDVYDPNGNFLGSVKNTFSCEVRPYNKKG